MGHQPYSVPVFIYLVVIKRGDFFIIVIVEKLYLDGSILREDIAPEVECVRDHADIVCCGKKIKSFSTFFDLEGIFVYSPGVPVETVPYGSDGESVIGVPSYFPCFETVF